MYNYRRRKKTRLNVSVRRQKLACHCHVNQLKFLPVGILVCRLWTDHRSVSKVWLRLLLVRKWVTMLSVWHGTFTSTCKILRVVHKISNLIVETFVKNSNVETVQMNSCFFPPNKMRKFWRILTKCFLVKKSTVDIPWYSMRRWISSVDGTHLRKI